MDILIISILISFLGLILYLIYKCIRWVFSKKVRIHFALIFMGLLMLAKTIDVLFFTKMEFIQSKVYPDLYLIKHPVKDKNALNKAIRDFITEKFEDKTPNLSFRFYEYYKSWNPFIFGDSGTAYFIDNEEDLTGIVVEDLSIYKKQKLATFNTIVKKDSTNKYGLLHFFENGYIIKTDTLQPNIKLD